MYDLWKHKRLLLILFKARRICSSRQRFASGTLRISRFSGLTTDLLKGAHFVFGLLLQGKNSGSGGTGRYQLENQSANCLRLMLAGSTRQSIRPFKAVEPFNSQFPILIGSRSGDRHTPLSAFVAECVLDTRNNFSA